VRGDNSSYQDRDFTALELPSDANGQTLTISDAGANAEHQIGLELRVRTIVDEDIPNGYAMHVRARNVGATPIDSLRLATFADWDLADGGEDQSIATREDATGPVPLYAVVSGQGYFVASGAVARDRAPVLYAIENDKGLNLYDGFSRDEKWVTLANGIASRTAGPTDVSLVTGRVLTALERDEEDTVLFVVGFGRNESEAVAALQALAGLDISSADEERARVTGMLGAARPNPARLEARIAVDLRGAASLGVYDALGRLVVDLTDAIPAGGTGELRVALDGLPAGAYIVRARDDRGAASTPLVVVR
jgi:hypothetical protein